MRRLILGTFGILAVATAIIFYMHVVLEFRGATKTGIYQKQYNFDLCQVRNVATG